MLWQTILVSLLASGAVARPVPGTVGALPQGRTSLPDAEASDPPVLVGVDREHRLACPKEGSVCPFPGGGSTVHVAEFYDENRPPAVGLTRAARVAGRRAVVSDVHHDPWQVDLVARLNQRISGSVVVAIFDSADRDAIHRREAKLVWDLDVNRRRWLGLKTVLDPATFAAGHTYLIRFAQVNGKNERILAEGELRLK